MPGRLTRGRVVPLPLCSTLLTTGMDNKQAVVTAEGVGFELSRNLLNNDKIPSKG